MLYKSIGERITYYRKKIGLSQEELGKRIQKGKGSISKYEKGQIAMDLETFVDISKALNIPPHLLLEYVVQQEGLKDKNVESSASIQPRDKYYMISYDGYNDRFIKSIIVINREKYIENAMFYHDVKDYSMTEDFSNSYLGTLSINGNIFLFQFENTTHKVEKGSIVAVAPLNKNDYYVGLCNGLSMLPVLPKAEKVFISKMKPIENDDLLRQLTFSKEQLSEIRRTNIVTVK